MNIFEIIAQYDKIALFRHINPDFDAYGSQYGLAQVIKDQYPEKKVMLLGIQNQDMLSKLNADSFDSFEDTTDALAIVTDTANEDRIDGDSSNYACRIKIDHHIVTDSYGNYNIEYPKKSSACQIIAELCHEYLAGPISVKAATYLYFGMITDSNRFLYDSTREDTFKAAGYLVTCGVNITEVYNALYLKTEKELRVQKYILNKYASYHNIAYYVLTQSDLDELEIERSEGSNYVNLLANIIDYPIYLAITENTELNNYRVSLRSRKIAINQVANKYHGGGHAQASGCTLDSLEQLPALLEDLQRLINQD